MSPRKPADAATSAEKTRHIYEVELVFLEPVLGTTPDAKDVYEQYVIEKGVSAGGKQIVQMQDELETLSVARGKTDFHRVGNTPIMYNYTITGMLVEACKSIRDLADAGYLSYGLTSYKPLIRGAIVARPRRIPFILSGPTYDFPRILRADTPKGQRTAPVCSVCVPQGSKLLFFLDVIGTRITEDLLREWLEYGERKGLGGWRSGGWGVYRYSMREVFLDQIDQSM